MKKLFALLAFALVFTNGLAQTKSDVQATESNYSNWLFVQSDKAVQYRFKLVKQEGDIGFYQVQFKTNFDDRIFCKHPTCLGYLLVFGYPDLDNQKNIETSYKFYNTYKEVYTRPELVPIRLSFPDGSKRLLKQEGFHYTLAGSTDEQPAINLFGNCVDDILDGKPDYHRCKPYQPKFIESQAIVLQ